jgi:hypothetical protein
MTIAPECIPIKTLKKQDSLELHIKSDSNYFCNLTYDKESNLWIIREFHNNILHNEFQRKSLRNWLSYLEGIIEITIRPKHI